MKNSLILWTLLFLSASTQAGFDHVWSGEKPPQTLREFITKGGARATLAHLGWENDLPCQAPNHEREPLLNFYEAKELDLELETVRFYGLPCQAPAPLKVALAHTLQPFMKDRSSPFIYSDPKPPLINDDKDIYVYDGVNIYE